jgi:hypothetical protein
LLHIVPILNDSMFDWVIEFQNSFVFVLQLKNSISISRISINEKISLCTYR